jgi:hypothetical protein
MNRPRLRLPLVAAPARKRLDKRRLYRWEGAFENWSRGWVAKNFWRVRATLQSEEDALQECAAIWVRCVNLYADKIDNPAWLMALYKTAVHNSWNTYARKDGDFRTTREPELLAQHSHFRDMTDHSSGPLAAKLAGASAELREVLALLFNAPAEALQAIFADDAPNWRVNVKLRSYCGLSPEAAPLEELKNLLDD